MNYAAYAQTLPSDLRNWVMDLLPKIGNALDPDRNGHVPAWQAALQEIPACESCTPQLNQAVVSDNTPDELDDAPWRAFHPWRKGPYRMGTLNIDTEWRSDWKWDRLQSALEPMSGRRCLDVGCGNGYHLWRMLGDGADLAIGLDPFLLYVFQFHATHRRMPLPGIQVLPLGAEAIRPDLHFDTVFSMGVLYHCKDHLGHLRLLKQALRPKGQVILETLTVPSEAGPMLIPEGRYAQMRNVHALPTVDTLMEWVRSCGYQEVAHIDTTPTTFEEQRSTDWMTFHSLRNFLDPSEVTKTIEGHPAPQRTLITAFR